MKDKTQVNAFIDKMTAFEESTAKFKILQITPQPIAIDNFVASSIKTSNPDLGQDMW